MQDSEPTPEELEVAGGYRTDVQCFLSAKRPSYVTNRSARQASCTQQKLGCEPTFC